MATTYHYHFFSLGMNTIDAYNNHLGIGEEEDMEMERYKEALERVQVVAPVHYNMDHAIRDMQVGHTRG